MSGSRRRILQLAGLSAAIAATFVARRSVAATYEKIIQPERPDDLSFVEQAFAMRRLADEQGDQSYGAIVVRNAVIIGQAPSRVLQHRDPTAHAEMEAIRDAAARLGSRDLTGCILYSSSRACPMCEAAAFWANIETMVYGRNAQQAGAPRLC